jgi:hypothetical protein
MNEKYHVIIWNTHEIYKTFDTLSAAKRCARALGHAGGDLSIFTSYSPIAYVGNDAKEVIYTDRFLARISEPHFPES